MYVQLCKPNRAKKRLPCADGDYRGASDCDAGRHLQHPGRAACRRGWDPVGGGDRRVVGVVSELHDYGAQPITPTR